MAEKYAPQNPPTSLQPLSAIGAGQLARIIQLLLWSLTILVLLQLVQVAGYWILGTATLSLIPYFSAATSIASFVFILSIWKLTRCARLYWDHDTLTDLALQLFLAALVLQMGCQILQAVSNLISLMGVAPDLDALSIFFKMTSLVILFGYILGAPSVMTLACSIDRQTFDGKPAGRHRVLLSFWLLALILEFIATVLLWAIIDTINKGQITLAEIPRWFWIILAAQGLIIIPVIWSFILFIPLGRRLRRMADHNLCPDCKYDLRGDLANGCPECGWGREQSITTIPNDTQQG